MPEEVSLATCSALVLRTRHCGEHCLSRTEMTKSRIKAKRCNAIANIHDYNADTIMLLVFFSFRQPPHVQSSFALASAAPTRLVRLPVTPCCTPLPTVAPSATPLSLAIGPPVSENDSGSSVSSALDVLRIMGTPLPPAPNALDTALRGLIEFRLMTCASLADRFGGAGDERPGPTGKDTCDGGGGLPCAAKAGDFIGVTLLS